MPETLKTIFLILFVIGGFIIALRITGLRMKKAGEFIIEDLRDKKAIDPSSAVELVYAKSSLFHFGLRDYRPQVLQELVKQGVVGIEEGERYFLRQE